MLLKFLPKDSLVIKHLKLCRIVCHKYIHIQKCLSFYLTKQKLIPINGTKLHNKQASYQRTQWYNKREWERAIKNRNENKYNAQNTCHLHKDSAFMLKRFWVLVASFFPLTPAADIRSCFEYEFYIGSSVFCIVIILYFQSSFPPFSPLFFCHIYTLSHFFSPLSYVS